VESGNQTPQTMAVRRRGDRRWPPSAWLILGLAAGMATWLGIVATQPPGDDVLPTVNRWLVRLGYPLFLAAFVATPALRLWPGAFTRRLVRERRGIGLAWAMIHLTHATAVLAAFEARGESMTPTVENVVGGFGFVLTAAMAATSNDAAMRRLGRGWRRLHGTGLWYLAFIYALSYGGRVAAQGEPWPVLAFSLITVGAALRARVAWRGRAPVAAPA